MVSPEEAGRGTPAWLFVYVEETVPASPSPGDGQSEAEPVIPDMKPAMRTYISYAKRQAVRESFVKNLFINGSTGELYNLPVKEYNILDKPRKQIECSVQNVRDESGVSLKVSAANSQPWGDSFILSEVLQEAIAR